MEVESASPAIVFPAISNQGNVRFLYLFQLLQKFSNIIQNEDASYRRVPVPPHRISPLKANWTKIYTPIVEHLKLQVRFNPKLKCVELKTSKLTVESSAIQKAADYIKAFGCGYECEVKSIVTFIFLICIYFTFFFFTTGRYGAFTFRGYVLGFF